MNNAMKRIKSALAVVVLGGVVTGCAAPATSTSPLPSRSTVGRYQLDGSRILDTTTGELFLADYDDGTWQKQVAPAATAKPRPAPATQADGDISSAQPAHSYPNAIAVNAVAENLRELERSKSDGILTADEYTKARILALAPFNNVQQLQLRNVGPERLHDELGALKQLREDSLITAQEYDRVRSAMVQSYLARE